MWVAGGHGVVLCCATLFALCRHRCCVCCRYGATEEAPASLVTLKDLVAACGEAARFFKPYQVGRCRDLRESGPRCHGLAWCRQALRSPSSLTACGLLA